MTSTSLLAQLRKLRAEAVVQRDWAVARVDALDVLIAQEEAGAGATSIVHVGDAQQPAPHTARPRSLPDGVIAALGRYEGGPVDFTTLHEAVVSVLGDVNDKSLRGTLPRMERDGLIHRPNRGMYKLGPVPKNAEGSADATAEPSDLSDQPGEEVIPDGNPAHRDLGPSSAGWLDRGHDHGASVAG